MWLKMPGRLRNRLIRDANKSARRAKPVVSIHMYHYSKARRVTESGIKPMRGRGCASGGGYVLLLNNFKSANWRTGPNRLHSKSVAFAHLSKLPAQTNPTEPLRTPQDIASDQGFSLLPKPMLGHTRYVYPATIPPDKTILRTHVIRFGV